MNNTGIVILAAGNSSRLGFPKQMVMYQGKTLLQHVVNEAIKAKLYPVVVVVGANAETVSKNFTEPIQFVHNTAWQQGMGSSIVAGVSEILSINTAIQHIILSVCDQPFISLEIFQQLIEKRLASGKNIVACAYADTEGTPILFQQKYFRDILKLHGEEGAKKLINLYRNDVDTVPFPKGNIDIDTIRDFEDLVNS